MWIVDGVCNSTATQIPEILPLKTIALICVNVDSEVNSQLLIKGAGGSSSRFPRPRNRLLIVSDIRE